MQPPLGERAATAGCRQGACRPAAARLPSPAGRGSRACAAPTSCCPPTGRPLAALCRRPPARCGPPWPPQPPWVQHPPAAAPPRPPSRAHCSRQSAADLHQVGSAAGGRRDLQRAPAVSAALPHAAVFLAAAGLTAASSEGPCSGLPAAVRNSTQNYAAAAGAATVSAAVAAASCAAATASSAAAEAVELPKAPSRRSITWSCLISGG
jgi:hypothetical protein